MIDTPQSRYYQRNKEKYAILRKEWRSKNPDYFKNYYRENRERIREYMKHRIRPSRAGDRKSLEQGRGYRLLNRDMILAKRKAAYWANVEDRRAEARLRGKEYYHKNRDLIRSKYRENIKAERKKKRDWWSSPKGLAYKESYKGRRPEISRRYWMRHHDRLIEKSSAYRRLNRQTIAEKQRVRYKKNFISKPRKPGVGKREHDRRYHLRHRKELCEKMRARYLRRKSTEQFKAVHAANSKAYQTKKERAMPSWVNRKEIARIYKEAAHKSMKTGIPHQVDHVWPLHGKGFMGLHVPWNLQVITAKQNRIKWNRRPDSVGVLS